MPDLLTHVLLAYAAIALATRASDRLSAHHVPVAMVGAAVPDLAKIGLLVDFDAVSAALGVPVSPLAFHRFGGVVVLAGIGALLVHRRERRLVFGLLSIAGAGHLILDAFVIRADGLAPPYLYPLTWWRPPAGSLYLSSDAWPAAIAILTAGLVWLGTTRTVTIPRSSERAD